MRRRPTGAGGSADPVHAIGIGPGDPSYLTARARQRLEAADVIVGFSTVVEHVASVTDAERLACGYDDEAETLLQFGERVAAGERGVAVLMGDPNVSGYQFLDKVEAAVDPAVRVVPGISSIQLAMSRARTPLEASTFVTLHKRGPLDDDFARLVQDVGERHLLVLPRPYDWMPSDIAAVLVGDGAPPGLDAIVFERLSRDDEAVHRTSLAALARTAGGDGSDDTPFSDLAVLVVRRTG
jgi:cobalt-precorrin-7 (C5)-methyltransferase